MFECKLNHLYDVFEDEMNEMIERYGVDSEDIREAVYDKKEKFYFTNEDGEEDSIWLGELIKLNREINYLLKD